MVSALADAAGCRTDRSYFPPWSTSLLTVLPEGGEVALKGVGDSMWVFAARKGGA
jgi:hypothetical protein